MEIASDDNGDRMYVESGDQRGCFGGHRVQWHVDVFSFLEIMSDRMKQESAGTARWIENSLLVRRGHRIPDDLRCEPIRRVILSKSMPFVTIDQRLVQNLENVRLNIAQLESSHMCDDASNQVDALSIGDDPIEKIALNRPKNAGCLKPSARQDPRWIILIHVEDGKRDGFGDNDQERMLEK